MLESLMGKDFSFGVEIANFTRTCWDFLSQHILVEGNEIHSINKNIQKFCNPLFLEASPAQLKN